MKSRILGGLTIVLVLASIGANLVLAARLADKAKKSGPSYHLFVKQSEPNPVIQIPLIWPGKAASLTAVGWEGCPACQRFKQTTLPALVKEGYSVKYTDKAIWQGPRITMGPTLFFYNDAGVIIKVYRGFMTPDQVKQWLKK